MSTHTDSVTAHNTQGFKSLTIEAGTGKIVGAETIEGELIQPFQHTDSVESLAKELRMVANMINMGEKIQWGHETTLMDKAAEMLTTLHTPKDTNSPDSISTEKDVYQHTDSVEAAVEDYLQQFPECPQDLVDCVLSQEAVNEFNNARLRGAKWLRTTLQATQSQQVEEAVLQADATGAYHSGYLAGKAEVEEAVRKERERIKAVITQVREKYGLDIPDEVDSIDYDTGSDVADDIEQALNPNHQD